MHVCTLTAIVLLITCFAKYSWKRYRAYIFTSLDSITTTKAKALHIHVDSLSQSLNAIEEDQITVSHPIKGEETDIIFLHNLLSKVECENLIAVTNKIGYLSVEGFKKGVRSNKRCRTFDQRMSSIIFDRIKQFCPETVIVDKHHWDIHSILPYWRYCKYKPLNHFSPHYDGSKVFEYYAMSIFTINIYLNDGFQGGGTRFYMQRKPNAKENDLNEAGPITHTIHPELGGALIFNHCNKGYLHDGEALRNNEKYIMRADLVYKLRENEVTSLQQMEQTNSCKFWSLQNAKKHNVTNYVGRQWKCACVSHEVTVTLV